MKLKLNYKMKKISLILLLAITFSSCKSAKEVTNKETKTPFVWQSANVYFLLTDRFYNGDKTNDFNYNRNKPTGTLRGFEGGDIRGIIQKLDEGYFENLANKYSETAVFGEVNYKVTPKWTATVGARAFQYKDTEVARIVDYAGGYVDSDYTRSGGKKSKSYFKLNTSYQFADDLLGYATFSQGFRRGGTNGFKDIGTKKVSDANASYQPDSTNNFELGLKGYALNRMLYIETGVYQIDWKNVQTYRSQDVEGFPVNGTANGPDARSRGFEFSSRYKLSDNWQATYSSTTTQAEWSGTVVNCLFANSTTDQCRTWEKGGKLGGSPKWKHNFGARFNTYLDNGTYLWASLSGRYTGPIAIDRADSPTSSVRERPAYTLLNANSGISFGNWDANFWIQNLVNKRAEVSAQEAGLMGARLRFATPRTMGVNVTYYFK